MGSLAITRCRNNLGRTRWEEEGTVGREKRALRMESEVPEAHLLRESADTLEDVSIQQSHLPILRAAVTVL